LAELSNGACVPRYIGGYAARPPPGLKIFVAHPLKLSTVSRTLLASVAETAIISGETPGQGVDVGVEAFYLVGLVWR